jgi:uncharacterized glyoxalase superfamily protein PhnB
MTEQQVDIFPALRYREAAKAMTRLSEAFGFAERMSVPMPDGGIAHAEMSFGSGWIMLGGGGEPDPQNPLGDCADRDLRGR